MHPLPRTVALLEEGIAAGQHAGAQLSVWREGREVADIAVGEARPGVPMSTQATQFWYSCCKPLAAIALGQLHESGKIDFDDPVALRIPEFARHGKESVTLKHVLTHTGGFRGSNSIEPHWGWDEILRFTCDCPLEPGWVPGRKAGYHATASWYLLAETVRRVDGRDYPRYVHEEILGPMGLSSSWMGMPGDVFRSLGDLRAGMFVTSGNARPPELVWDEERDSTECRPGSNARGPARELAQVVGMLGAGGSWAGTRILRPETVALLTARHRQGLHDETFQQQIDWGLGLLLNTPAPTARVLNYGFGTHASLEAFGHGGMQTSICFADPAHGLAVAWICNGMCGERIHRDRNHRINTTIYEELGLGGSR